jgi:hypothetical protein
MILIFFIVIPKKGNMAGDIERANKRKINEQTIKVKRNKNANSCQMMELKNRFSIILSNKLVFIIFRIRNALSVKKITM